MVIYLDVKKCLKRMPLVVIYTRTTKTQRTDVNALIDIVMKESSKACTEKLSNKAGEKKKPWKGHNFSSIATA